MATRVDFSPASLSFGAVAPESGGPDISVDPSFGPPGISFAGAVSVTNVPAPATVTAAIKSGAPIFKVRDLIVLDWVLEPVDPGELPPGHHGPLPRVKVLEVSGQSDGLTPLAVTTGQYLVVRVEYAAPSEGSNFAGVLAVTGDAWEPVEIALSLYLSGVSTTVLHTPVKLAQGTMTDMTIATKVVSGPNGMVRFEMSPTQLHSGVSISGTNEFFATDAMQDFVLRLRAATDAPIGDNALAINRFFMNNRSGFFVPITMDPLSSIQKIRGLSITPEPSALTFVFTTDRPSKPLITIWKRSINHDPVKEMVPDNQVAVSLGGPVPLTSHSIRVSGLPVAQALWFGIDAAAEDAPAGAFASRSGETATLQRVCLVKVWSIEVLQAGGDDGGPEDGNELDFGFLVFDDATGARLSEETASQFDSVDHGETLTPSFGDKNGFVTVAGGTDTIVPYIKGVSQDPDFNPIPLPGPALYWSMPDTLPDHPDSGANGDGSWADAYASFSPPTTIGDTTTPTFVLSTGPTLLSYLAKLTFRTIVSDPFNALSMVYPDAP
jgi:hypothetical protein